MLLKEKYLKKKQMIERLPMALAQLKEVNTFNNLPNEVGQAICILKKVCQNLNKTRQKNRYYPHKLRKQPDFR